MCPRLPAPAGATFPEWDSVPAEKDRLRMLALSLAKNNVKFHKLPNNTFGLLSWYDPAMIKRAKDERGKQNTSVEEPEDAAEQKAAV